MSINKGGSTMIGWAGMTKSGRGAGISCLSVVKK